MINLPVQTRSNAQHKIFCWQKERKKSLAVK